ncbi:hypothetical protein WDU94_015022 [Cyamophila willieti]
MLTARYKIPIELISYEHIEQLKHSRETERELEKIIKILESGELGHYPDLLKTAKDKLRSVNPKHKLVRFDPEPVNKLECLDPGLKDQIRNELREWCKDMKDKETKSANAEKNNTESQDGKIQPQTIEQAKHQSDNSTIIRGVTRNNNNVNQKTNRIKSCDYAAWDKFDPDVEMKKMDVAIERERVKTKRNEKKKKEEKEKEYLTEEEKRSQANALRIKGNEAYTSGKHVLAIELYTASISLHPTTLTLGNRAQVHIKLAQYNTALTDCEQALRMDPNFVKGMYRKALALYHLKRFEEASDWFNRVLQLEPGNQTVHDYLTKLHSKVPVRMRLDGNRGTQTSVKIIELDDTDNENLEANGAKNMKIVPALEEDYRGNVATKSSRSHGTNRVKIIPFDDEGGTGSGTQTSVKIMELDDKEYRGSRLTSRGKLGPTRSQAVKIAPLGDKNKDGFGANEGETLVKIVDIFDDKHIKENVVENKETTTEKITKKNINRYNEWGLVKQPCVCKGGKPEFIKQFEDNKKKIKNIVPSSPGGDWNPTQTNRNPSGTNAVSSARDWNSSGTSFGNTKIQSENNRNPSTGNHTNQSGTFRKNTNPNGTNNTSAETLNNQPNNVSTRTNKTSNEIKRKNNEFLNVDEEYRPASIVEILGPHQHVGPGKNNNHNLVSKEMEIVQKTKKDMKDFSTGLQQKPKIEVLKSVDFEEEM